MSQGHNVTRASTSADYSQAVTSGHPVTIIVLTWNGIDYTKRCLDTVRANTTYPGYCLIVADNGSTDGTVEYLEAQRSITSLSNGSNLGFAKGNNRAIISSDPKSDIVLLNNDTEIRQADWIERLQATAYGSPDIGVVGCRLAKPDGILQHAGTYMPIETFWGQQLGSGEKDEHDDDQWAEHHHLHCDGPFHLQRFGMQNP